MALHITDPELDALAEKARQALKAKSKTDAVRQALERVVEDAPETVAERDRLFFDRIKGLQDEVKRLGTPNPAFDDKAFLDEMWES